MIDRCEGKSDPILVARCRAIQGRLLSSPPLEGFEAIAPADTDAKIEMLAREIRSAINANNVVAGIDRLHTYCVMRIRRYSSQRGHAVRQDDPLHGEFGAYIKLLRRDGLIKSAMTERILLSSIKNMEEFNKLRNQESMAHDNELVERDEAQLITSHMLSLIRFIDSIESADPRNARSNGPTLDSGRFL